MDFTDKRVVVTGSSRSSGFAIAKAFLDAGARVAINGRTEQSVSAATERLGGGERLVAAPGDIGTVPGCESVAKTAIDALGGLDILVNSAGIGAGRPIEDCDEAMWDAHVDVNLKGTFFCCRAALPALRKSAQSARRETTAASMSMSYLQMLWISGFDQAASSLAMR